MVHPRLSQAAFPRTQGPLCWSARTFCTETRLCGALMLPPSAQSAGWTWPASSSSREARRTPLQPAAQAAARTAAASLLPLRLGLQLRLPAAPTVQRAWWALQQPTRAAPVAALARMVLTAASAQLS